MPEFLACSLCLRSVQALPLGLKLQLVCGTAEAKFAGRRWPARGCDMHLCAFVSSDGVSNPDKLSRVYACALSCGWCVPGGKLKVLRLLPHTCFIAVLFSLALLGNIFACCRLGLITAQIAHMGHLLSQFCVSLCGQLCGQ